MFVKGRQLTQCETQNLRTFFALFEHLPYDASRALRTRAIL